MTVNATRRGGNRELATFTGRGYSKGRGLVVVGLWHLVGSPLLRVIWMPARLRSALLRAFGAQIGRGVLVRHRVRVLWPWKLTVGDHAWIGEGAWLLNLEPITIGANTCISQEAFLCTGSHDRRSPSFEFDNGPITIGSSVWIAARATVLRGVTVGDNAVVGAGATVHRDVPADTVVTVATTTSAPR